MSYRGLEGHDTKNDNQRENGTGGAGLHHQEEKAYVAGACGYRMSNDRRAKQVMNWLLGEGGEG